MRQQNAQQATQEAAVEAARRARQATEASEAGTPCTLHTASSRQRLLLTATELVWPRAAPTC